MKIRTLLAALGLVSSFALAHSLVSSTPAPTPPMGWNSWDCFGTTITEEQARAQADAQAKLLKPYGWDILTVDIQWYEPNSKGHNYKPGAPLSMDEYSRLIPAPNRFPSAVNGAGFKPLADYIHSKGLRMGIHIMRGIPRQAVRDNTPILGTNVRATDIADQTSTCKWNPDMYGVDMRKPGAQAYYDSLFKLYASWGVDLVKVDDIARPYDETQKAEIEAIRKAIDACGRPMVLSLSPGDTPIEQGDHVMRHANMWRISDDFWDNWKLLKEMFVRVDKWTPYRTEGAWPDADMLPFGVIRFDKPSRFTRDEQFTCMTLWCIARSPLILGGDMTRLDEFTLGLLTNPETLAVNQHSTSNRQLFNRDGLIAWVAESPDKTMKYVALFNTRDEAADVSVTAAELGLGASNELLVIRDLWQRSDTDLFRGNVTRKLAPHASAFLALTHLKPAQAATLTIDTGSAGKAISTDLVGIFFEDISYAADGGLYAELVQNRSFEYHASEQQAWNNLSIWQLDQRAGAKGAFYVEMATPVHSNNPHYAIFETGDIGSGDGLALVNPGFDGIPVKAGEHYEFSAFARQLFAGGRWDSVKQKGTLSFVVRLESKDGTVLAEAPAITIGSPDWQRYAATLTATKTDSEARLVLLAKTRGSIALDEVSLFPQATFRNRPNGLRADLAQTIADLKPRFMRFPGGCLVHGDGLSNMYRWKDTIGPIEQRRQQPNLWRYHQTNGLGYFEYFQFCEDIGAIPLPVVPAAVCCQNSDHMGGTGQRGLPMEDMPAYIQEVLDLIEWANGPATSTWGAKRAAAGHPEPFGLKYLGVGNEEYISPVFEERFTMIYEAVKKAHPEIVVVGTSGPFWRGEDYEEGWRIANKLKVPVIDEHYYESPAWFWGNLNRYDSYDRSGAKVYIGEYAAHDERRRTTLRSALAEAAHLTALERNGDIVQFASYAPLLARRGYTRWNPNLIYFTDTEVFPTINYHVQQLFSLNAGDKYLDTKIALAPVTSAPPLADFSASTVRDSKTGDIIIKLVNGARTPRAVKINLGGINLARAGKAQCTVLSAGDPNVSNDYDSPTTVIPKTSEIEVSSISEYTVLPNSLTIIRFNPKR